MKSEVEQMDELEFRREVYANPNVDDPRVKQAAEADPAKMAFLKDLRKLDADLTEAAKVPVPENLAHKLIWQGTITDFETHKKRSRRHLALAASIAFVVGVSFTVWQQQSHTIDFSHEALAHMYYQEMIPGAQAVSLTDVNAKLQTFGASLASNIGNIMSANYCHLDKQRSLHLVVDTEDGFVSIFVLPKEANGSFDQAFSDTRYAGERLDVQKANVLIVGDKGQNLNHVKRNVKEQMIFSA
jgi:hypothetical protein